MAALNVPKGSNNQVNICKTNQCDRKSEALSAYHGRAFIYSRHSTPPKTIFISMHNRGKLFDSLLNLCICSRAKKLTVSNFNGSFILMERNRCFL